MSPPPESMTLPHVPRELLAVQREFNAALFAATPGDMSDVGIAIYANNLREGFRKALALEFPVVERLVGSDCFRALARDFQDAHPSHCGDLHHVGAPFARWLESSFANGEHAYLPDVARLEWARESAIVAADARPFDVEALRAVDPDVYEALTFALHPTATLLASPWPIVRIWQTNQPDAEPETIDLDDGGDHVLVLRGSEDIDFHLLDRSTFLWLDALAQGCTLGEAIVIASTAADALDSGLAHAEFDLGTALQFVLRTGALTKEMP